MTATIAASQKQDKPRTRYIVQWRTNSGWRYIRGYVSEGRALARLRNMTDNQTYRVITGDPYGDFKVIGMRCPSVPNDPWAK